MDASVIVEGRPIHSGHSVSSSCRGACDRGPFANEPEAHLKLQAREKSRGAGRPIKADVRR